MIFLIVILNTYTFCTIIVHHSHLKTSDLVKLKWQLAWLDFEIFVGCFGLWCLMLHSTIFQLYHGCQFYWCRKPEKTTDLLQATDKCYHTIIHVIELACYATTGDFWPEIWSHNWRFFIDVFDACFYCLLVFSFCLFQYWTNCIPFQYVLFTFLSYDEWRIKTVFIIYS